MFSEIELYYELYYNALQKKNVLIYACKVRTCCILSFYNNIPAAITFKLTLYFQSQYTIGPVGYGQLEFFVTWYNNTVTIRIWN